MHENWIKYEHVICALKFDEEKRVLKVYPDFSKDVPYHLEIDKESPKNYYYFIEHVSEGMPEDLSQAEEQIFKKVSGFFLWWLGMESMC